MRKELYTRPAKPLFLHVAPRFNRAQTAPEPQQARPAPLIVDRATECHVTPDDVADLMVEYLAPGTETVLEPSAGTGALLQALTRAGVEAGSMVAIERHHALAAHLAAQGFAVNQTCFLEYAAEQEARFARIIMNPPFSKVRQHIAAAVRLLAQGGVLVALVPITFSQDGFEDLETLPADTFALAKVHTKLVRFQRG